VAGYCLALSALANAKAGYGGGGEGATQTNGPVEAARDAYQACPPDELAAFNGSAAGEDLLFW
jgi:hypothetical protein